MVGKRDCICCGKRLGKNGKRRVTLSLLQIFVSARLFPLPIPDDCFVCEICRWMYKKWSVEHHVKEILLKLDGSSKYTDSINEEYEEIRDGHDSNDSYVRVFDIHIYSKHVFP